MGKVIDMEKRRVPPEFLKAQKRLGDAALKFVAGFLAWEAEGRTKRRMRFMADNFIALGGEAIRFTKVADKIRKANRKK